ncbi:hypothetical protein FRC98_03365 [Lujinxingia vulgaris]|uniref:SCP domain-containing protein n=1 Tax=Lujinxingia vulgaris TaxID=2600176 RepID=A0A5C6XIV0_9DELT|nr:CAP domain-containing protein [Lujinxingia vulgaris]TXD39448.1 hypothetical protein FRC98_03365 [Lujinxingia vulgaris]
MSGFFYFLQEVAMDARAVVGMFKRFTMLGVVGGVGAASMLGGSMGCAAGGGAEPTLRYVEVEGGLGGAVADGDWEWAESSRHVRCGADDIRVDDLGVEVVEGGEVSSWSSVVADRGDRCGDDYETALFRLANCERRQRGISELTCDMRLVVLGRQHSADMRDRDYFSHISPRGQSPFDRMDAVGLSYRAAAENIGLAPTVAHAHRGWMDSQGHRENVLREEVTHYGVGVVASGKGYFKTALFIALP